MKIHHITDEWDYTLSVSPFMGSKYYLTFSILRQPERTPDFTCGGIRIRSSGGVELDVSSVDIVGVWLRGADSPADKAEGNSRIFPTHSAAVKQLSYVYNSLRQYENYLGSLSRVLGSLSRVAETRPHR